MPMLSSSTTQATRKGRDPRSAGGSRYRLATATALGLTLALSGALRPMPAVAARETLNFSTPFEVSESPAGNYLAAWIAGADHDTTAAATFFREALRFDPRNPQLIERAFLAALANGNMLDAFTLADRLVARDPTNNLAHLTLGVRAMKNRQYPSARAQFSRGGPAQERDVTSDLLSAWSWAGSGDEKHALASCDRLSDENLTIFRDFHAGLIAQMMGDKAEAGKRLKMAYVADKTTLRLVDAYARYLSRVGDRAQATKIYQDFDAILPNHPLVNAALAELKAGKTLDPLIKTPEQGAGEVLYGLGSVASNRPGDEVAAMVYLRLSLGLWPRNGNTLITLADIYDRLKQNEQSISVYEGVPDSSPLRTTADIQIAHLLDNMGKKTESAKYLHDIVAAHPTDEDALFALGEEERGNKNYAAAAATYTRALAVSKKPEKVEWRLYYFRGISYERDKSWDKAVTDFRRALSLYPDQPQVLNYLGYSWVDRGQNLDEAFKMLNKAVELRPSDGYIVDSLGWAYYKLGKYQDAVRELEKAIDLKPGDPTVNDHLGDAYWHIGRKLEAHFQWNHARDMNPEPEDKQKILDKIAHGLPADTQASPKDAETKVKGSPSSDTSERKDGG